MAAVIFHCFDILIHFELIGAPLGLVHHMMFTSTGQWAAIYCYICLRNLNKGQWAAPVLHQFGQTCELRGVSIR
ncbi:hypothetical protein B194_3447 [Serratia plymuthica A30]|nr:hypothetical protein B194_3447 [Serratia plymuthica A30]